MDAKNEHVKVGASGNFSRSIDHINIEGAVLDDASTCLATPGNVDEAKVTAALDKATAGEVDFFDDEHRRLRFNSNEGGEDNAHVDYVVRKVVEMCKVTYKNFHNVQDWDMRHIRYLAHGTAISVLRALQHEQEEDEQLKALEKLVDDVWKEMGYKVVKGSYVSIEEDKQANEAKDDTEKDEDEDKDEKEEKEVNWHNEENNEKET